MEKMFDLFLKQWALVTAGTPEHCNTMTIGWGGLGTLWNKPVCTVYVKPCRHTHSFLEQNEYFTVSFFPEQYKPALRLLGQKSGRDGDKITESGLTLLPLEEDTVTFREAEKTLVCRKIYRQDLDPAAMPPEMVQKYYTEEAPHTMFVGEVVRVL